MGGYDLSSHSHRRYARKWNFTAIYDRISLLKSEETDDEKIGIAHIGWRGLCLGLIEKMLINFDLKNLHVFVGPFNHSFEIKKDFCFEKIQEKFGEKYFVEEKGNIIFLFKDAIMSLLPKNTEFDSRNTFKDLSLPSFRRDKTEERLVTVISFK